MVEKSLKKVGSYVPTFFDLCSNHFPLKKQEGRFGIEIETEVAGPDAYKGKIVPDAIFWGFKDKNPFWSIHSDGSLRNLGIEYVLTKPLSFQASLDALDNFKETFEGVPFIKGSPSTSVHVHMNIQPMTVRQISLLVLSWIFFENILVEFSGESRRSNLFCLPTRMAEGNLRNFSRLLSSLSNYDPIPQFNVNQTKYAAMNLSPITKFGTLEVRTFRGETEAEEIKKWLVILNSLYEYSLKGNIDEFILLVNENPEALFEIIFGQGTPLEESLSKTGRTISDFVDPQIFYVVTLLDMIDMETIDKEIDPPQNKKRVRKSFLETVAQLESTGPQPIMTLDDFQAPEGDDDDL